MLRLRWLIALSGVSMLVLLALGGYCLSQAHALQTRLDHGYVGEQARRALTPALERGEKVEIEDAILLGRYQETADFKGQRDMHEAYGDAYLAL